MGLPVEKGFILVPFGPSFFFGDCHNETSCGGSFIMTILDHEELELSSTPFRGNNKGAWGWSLWFSELPVFLSPAVAPNSLLPSTLNSHFYLWVEYFIIVKCNLAVFSTHSFMNTDYCNRWKTVVADLFLEYFFSKLHEIFTYKAVYVDLLVLLHITFLLRNIH